MISENFVPQHVAVLSTGAWGTPLAVLLAKKGHHVSAWDMPEVVEYVQRTHTHPRLPGLVIPEAIRFTRDLAQALGDPTPDAVVVTTPSQLVRSLMERCRQCGVDGIPRWVFCTKGIEEETLLPIVGVAESVLGTEYRSRFAVLSGPSLAPEVAAQRPTTVAVAAYEAELSQYFQALFMTDRFRVYTQDDVIGVELGGSLKNVIAIAAGICDGLDLGENARAALITRGLAEMIRLGVAMGAQAQTFAGLAGMGDLIVTCASRVSRNHRFGELLAKGRTREEALQEIGMAVEGVPTARSAYQLARRHNIIMPIVSEVHAIIYEGKKPLEAVDQLMQRGARPERD